MCNSYGGRLQPSIIGSLKVSATLDFEITARRHNILNSQVVVECSVGACPIPFGVGLVSDEKSVCLKADIPEELPQGENQVQHYLFLVIGAKEFGVRFVTYGREYAQRVDGQISGAPALAISVLILFGDAKREDQHS